MPDDTKKFSKLDYVTLIVRVTVLREDAEAAKEALVGGLIDDDCPCVIYSTTEAQAKKADARQHFDAYGE